MKNRRQRVDNLWIVKSPIRCHRGGCAHEGAAAGRDGAEVAARVKQVQRVGERCRGGVEEGAAAALVGVEHAQRVGECRGGIEEGVAAAPSKERQL